MEEPIPLPISPVEPDVAATPVAVQIDPLAVLPSGTEPEEVMWAVPPNTLVFRGQGPTMPAARAGHRGKLSHPQPVSACAYYVRNDSAPPIPFGIAIDGNASAAESRRWPDERGRLAIAVSGTVTLAVHPEDIDSLTVGDRLAVGHTLDPYTCGFVGYEDFQIPRIVKFNPQSESLKKLEKDLQKADATKDPDSYNSLLQQHRALSSFGVALELGFCEMRVLLTP